MPALGSHRVPRLALVATLVAALASVPLARPGPAAAVDPAAFQGGAAFAPGAVLPFPAASATTTASSVYLGNTLRTAVEVTLRAESAPGIAIAAEGSGAVTIAGGGLEVVPFTIAVAPSVALGSYPASVSLVLRDGTVAFRIDFTVEVRVASATVVVEALDAAGRPVVASIALALIGTDGETVVAQAEGATLTRSVAPGRYAATIRVGEDSASAEAHAPAGGTTTIQVRLAAPPEATAVAAASASTAPAPAPAGSTASGGGMLPLALAGLLILGVLAVGFVALRRRHPRPERPARSLGGLPPVPPEPAAPPLVRAPEPFGVAQTTLFDDPPLESLLAAPARTPEAEPERAAEPVPDAVAVAPLTREARTAGRRALPGFGTLFVWAMLAIAGVSMAGAVVTLVASAPASTPSPGATAQPTDAATPRPRPTPSPMPSPTASPSPTPTPEPSYATYVIKSGDTLSRIAAKFGTTIDAIVQLNGIVDKSKIRVGQVLLIPPQGWSPPPSVAP